MGGDATFNLVQIVGRDKNGMVTGSSGALEFSIGASGAKMRFGTGGMNISLSNLKAVAKGIDEAKKVSDWKHDTEKLSTLNGINMVSYGTYSAKERLANKDNLEFQIIADALENNVEIAKAVWGGALGVEYSEMNNAYGSYSKDSNTIKLNSSLLGGGREEAAKLAAVLSHEGTHAAGNRIEGVAHTIANATYDVLNTNFKLNGDENFSQQMIDAIYDERSWNENVGDTDWWKLKYIKDSNGNITHQIEWDDSLDLTIEDLDGNTMVIDKSKITDEKEIEDLTKWLAEKKITLDDNTKNEITKIGNISGATKLLMDSVKNANAKADYDINATKFITAIKELIDSKIEISNLGEIPDQSKKYQVVPGKLATITTKYGYRIVNDGLYTKIKGNLYEYATTVHEGWNIAGDSVIQTPMQTIGISMRWSKQSGQILTSQFDNKLKIEIFHTDANSEMNLLKAMLLSKSTSNLLAGLQFGTAGSTGTACAGAHAHIETFSSTGKRINPQQFFDENCIPANYQVWEAILSGYQKGTPYNDPKILNDLMDYSESFRKRYVEYHSDDFKPQSFYTGSVGWIYTTFDSSSMSYKSKVYEPTKANNDGRNVIFEYVFDPKIGDYRIQKKY